MTQLHKIVDLKKQNIYGISALINIRIVCASLNVKASHTTELM